MLEVVDDPKEVDAAYARQYDKLATVFASILPSRGMIAEIGSGKGQLTIPLAKLRPRSRFELVDSFSGPYAGTLRQLKQAVTREKLRGRVKVHNSDFLDWISYEYSDKYSAIISSEFLPEISSYELKMFLPQCYRVLRRGGSTIHSFLSPTPRNPRQRLLMQADADPRWTKTPPKEWFSPKPTLVISALKRMGFRSVRLRRIKSNLTTKSDAAKELLRTWDVRDSFWKRYESRLVKDGLEIPDWIIISGSKSRLDTL